MKKTYQTVEISRDPDAGPGNYTVAGLPEGAGFKDPDNYEKHRALWLKIDGHAVSCDHMEIGEHRRPVTLKQGVDGGGMEIELE